VEPVYLGISETILTIEYLVEVFGQVPHVVDVGAADLLPKVRVELVDRPVNDGFQLVACVLHRYQVQLAEFLVPRVINEGAELLRQVPLVHANLVYPILGLLEEQLAGKAHEDVQGIGKKALCRPPEVLVDHVPSLHVTAEVPVEALEHRVPQEFQLRVEAQEKALLHYGLL